jgi:hypothetical protein
MNAPCDYKGINLTDPKRVHLSHLSQAGINNKTTEFSKDSIEYLSKLNVNAAPHKVLSTGNNQAQSDMDMMLQKQREQQIAFKQYRSIPHLSNQ